MSNPICAPLWRTWLGLASLIAGQAFTGTAQAARSPDLAAITSYTIQLQNVGRDLDRLAASDHDLIIIEPSVAGDDDQRRELTRSEVARLQTKPDGSRRIVLAYMSVGEAEDYRAYWRPEWATSAPNWLMAENCRWRGNHIVRFWDEAWHRILVSGSDAVLPSLIAAGFDGVSLDRVDVFEELERVNPRARGDMITLVSEIAAAARNARPDFLVLAHNPESLLTDAGFRSTIDGVLKEDLLYGIAGTGKRNTAEAIDWSNKRLAMAREDGKPVLVAEYLTDRERADDTELELLERSFLPGIFPRSLDGSNPLSSARELPRLTLGTPENAAETCDSVWGVGGSQ